MDNPGMPEKMWEDFLHAESIVQPEGPREIIKRRYISTVQDLINALEEFPDKQAWVHTLNYDFMGGVIGDRPAEYLTIAWAVTEETESGKLRITLE